MSTFFDNLINYDTTLPRMVRAIEDVFQGAKSFVKQLSLIALEIALVNLIK